MRFSPLLDQLIEALRCLPGVGKKTAERMALYLLTRDRENGKRLAEHLLQAMTKISHCQSCRIFSETPCCEICSSPQRDHTIRCIVENPIDVTMIEQTGSYKGKYFVLLGRLSPLDGIGPDDIGLPHLKSHLEQGEIHELILATNPTVEGEATAHYISTLAKQYRIKVTRIAQGVPKGCELEYVDSSTITLAMTSREEI
ncbi:MAG: recombination protein RecR [Gammaproteobacteria bacterium RIFCSPHIGHO2_12_FULL_38_14]|nr:MAG: recombination protein RecR [Gammaproteobacteria bacterium RIFCSPHIGHO2_12_FULL_38_14]